MGDLKCLETLELKSNWLTRLPEYISEMRGLQFLHLDHNLQLNSLHVNLLDLQRLMMVSTKECFRLKEPPRHVCDKGLEAIQIYYSDIRDRVSATVKEAKVAGKKRNGV